MHTERYPQASMSFMIDEPLFTRNPPGIATQLTIVINNAVARNYDGDLIGGIR